VEAIVPETVAAGTSCIAISTPARSSLRPRAIVAAARTTARALDHAPNPYVAGTVARVHLEAIRILAGRPAPESDELDTFLRSLRPTEVRDSSDA